MSASSLFNSLPCNIIFFSLACFFLICQECMHVPKVLHKKTINFRCCFVSLPPLWSSGRSSWLQIQRLGFDFLLYQIFWGAVDLERSPLSLVSTSEELLERKSSDSGLEIREYGRRDPSRSPRGTPLYPQRLELTSPTSGGRSVGVVRLRIQATEFLLLLLFLFVSSLGKNVLCNS
jgi:hypothetical protein